MMRVVVKTLWLLFGCWWWLFTSSLVTTTAAAAAAAWSVSSVTVRPTAALSSYPCRNQYANDSYRSSSSSIQRVFALTRRNFLRRDNAVSLYGCATKTAPSDGPMTKPNQSFPSRCTLFITLLLARKESVSTKSFWMLQRVKKVLSVWKQQRRFLFRFMAVLVWGLFGWYGALEVPPASANSVHTNNLLFFPGGATTTAKKTCVKRVLTGSGVVLATVAYGASRVEQYRQSRRRHRSHPTELLLPETLLNVNINCAAVVSADDSAIVNSYATMSSLSKTSATTTSSMGSNMASTATTNQFQYDLNAETASTTTTSVETVTLPSSPLEREVDTGSSVALSDVDNAKSPEMGNSVNAMAAHEQAVDKLVPNVALAEQGQALPKVLQKLFQNGANKYVEKSITEKTPGAGTGTSVAAADSNAPKTPLEEAMPPLFFANAVEVVLEPSPTEIPATKSTTSALSTNGLTSAKEKISQFFFPALKRDDATTFVAPPMVMVPGIDRSTPVSSTKAARSSETTRGRGRVGAAIPLHSWSDNAAWTKARQQPKSVAEEARLQAKYAAIASLEERAFTILVDLGMVTLHSPPPQRPLTTSSTTSPSASTAVVNDESEWG
jgi:hypothetical protein